jgi:predicted GNAT family acetyltransferase
MNYFSSIKLFLAFFASILFLTNCSTNEMKSTVSIHPYINYFYPQDSVPVVYMYRDVANGLEEQFHRIYSINDSYGLHTIVEIYTSSGRIIEALNYNVDSLIVIDHMVVDKKMKKVKAAVMKHKLIPMNMEEETWFASKFPGFKDSTIILSEIKRKVDAKGKFNWKVLEDERESIQMNDFNRKTLYNPFTKEENEIQGISHAIFSEGIGLSEWFSDNKKVHYKLERIISQDEWMKMIIK